MVCCFLFFAPGTLGDWLLTTLHPGAGAPVVATLSPIVEQALAILLWGYVLLLPLARMGQSYNLYVKRALPAPLQSLLDWYSNIFGLILWRVFSADLTNFTIRIFALDTAGNRRLLSNWVEHGRFFTRFNQVAEAIVVTTLFTTLKYYPSNRAIFRERIVRYARTLPAAPTGRVLFEHVTLKS